MRSVAVATVICLAAVGCGKDKGSNGAEQAPVSLSGQVNDHGKKDLGSKDEVDVEQDDFYFGPTYIKAKPGSTIKVELENDGNVPHTFTIDGMNVDVTVDKGTRKDVSVTLPSSGAVVFYCRFHRGQGMQGAFYSKDGDTVGSTSGSSSSPSSGDNGYGYGK